MTTIVDSTTQLFAVDKLLRFRESEADAYALSCHTLNKLRCVS